MVAEYPFEDHQAPTFGIIYDFCVDLDAWLKSHEDNVAGIHCKAGKGRTGVMICCYMLFSKQFSNAYDSMRYYGMIRTKNRKVKIINR
jgi:phosphatidylinositol-3,4,5-trisphosphate 3-phosphatase/dual-specificity protein phosphatase PTEN